MARNIIIYYQDENDKYIIWNKETDKITVENSFNAKTANWFYINNPKYEKTEQGLKEYVDAFFKSNKQLRQKYNIDYSYSYNDRSAIIITFQRFCKLEGDLKPTNFNGMTFKIPAFDDIEATEVEMMDNTYNAGLIYYDKDKEETIESFGYDFKSYYAYVMGNTNFKIPTKRGKLKKILEIPEKIKAGFYKVQIVCNHKDIKKVFAFSKDNIYTHYCLKFAIKYKEQFNIDINLITDCDYNCYIYKKSDMIHSSDIFGEWYKYLLTIKNDLKNNILVKPLMTQLWATLIKTNKTKKTEEQITENNFDVGISYTHKYRIIIAWLILKKIKPIFGCSSKETQKTSARRNCSIG